MSYFSRRFKNSVRDLKFSKGFKRSFYSKVQIYPLKKHRPLMPILSFVLLGGSARCNQQSTDISA